MNNEKVTLVICDGMGLSPEVTGNAIYAAATPTFDYLLHNYPALRLLAAGTEVGLNMGEPGNSEVGHLTIGTGQVLPQAFQIINSAIKSNAYRTNAAFVTALESLRQTPEKTLHIVGLISMGGVHGHIDHIIALLQLAHDYGIQRVALHAITDGRDSPQRVAVQDLMRLQPYLDQFPFGVVATIGGRYYAMDRDNSWERTDAYYWAMMGRSYTADHAGLLAIQAGYNRGETDENLTPTVIQSPTGEAIAPLQAGDTVLFTNYRPDRIRQLATRVIMTSLPLTVVTMTDYFLGKKAANPLPETRVLNAYPLPKPTGTLAAALSRAGKTQLHIAETEKYAHITYFFNGHEEEKNSDEQWLLIPSVKIDSFARAPEMSAAPITTAYFYAREHHPADFVTINYANMDMVGHTGNFEATKQAVTYVDSQIKALVDYAEQHNEWIIFTADHGNAEQMVNLQTGEIDKEHTTNPVPLIVVHPSLKQDRPIDKLQLATVGTIGILADIAPTILDILGIPKPQEMVGSSLLSQFNLPH
ncbi:MAG TPA: 2,3-bisphosphoglycerate-independent phosphoglycerate mutase [Patescibacteria group bacterium]